MTAPRVASDLAERAHEIGNESVLRPIAAPDDVASARRREAYMVLVVPVRRQIRAAPGAGDELGRSRRQDRRAFAAAGGGGQRQHGYDQEQEGARATPSPPAPS